MCGIAGFVDPKLSPGEAEVKIQDMLKCISHRGPDARSSYYNESCCLGHNRLSIIDLSEEANQPMHFDNYAIIFNGEIYNYLEIKRRLVQLGVQFKTKSDTEVVLASYKMWGSNCVKEFVGMWSFALWDKQKKELFASRDRFGIKPFYYIYQGNCFYFGSECRTLKKSPLFSNAINYNQVSRGLQMGWICYNDETYFEKIKALPAAHNLIFKDGSLSIERYWDIETGNYSDTPFEQKKDQFLELFTDSIKLHLRSDVTVGSCLSGGLDSSAIVSMVQHLNPGTHYKSFSIYYEGEGDVDERPFVNEVIRKYPAIDPYYFSPSDDDVTNSFHHAMDHAEIPATGSSFLSQYFLMKLIADHKIKVVLDGQGSDEYLAGYKHTFYRIVADQLRGLNIYKGLKSATAINTHLGGSTGSLFAQLGKDMLSAVMKEQQLYALEYKKYLPFVSTIDPDNIPFNLEERKGNRTDNFLYHLLFNTMLPSLLQYEDRNSMAYSIESRVPFLDHRLVEFAFQLHNDDKVKGTETKYILRKSLSGILPSAVEARKDKKGFVTPGETKWLRGPLSFLMDDDFKSLSFLDNKKVARLVSDYKKGDNRYTVLNWRIATLNYWVKNFV